jgi:hypothetical protein
MAPGEVRSLQQLAMAHGGSLTINPQTGLPEAGFLSSILPMVLGAGAMMIPGLQGFGAAGIAAGIGGLQALRTGSLKKGLMAGLGAYGGAGLGSALAGAGAQSLATAAAPAVDVGQAMAAGAGDATANLAANATIPTGVAGNFSNMGTGISNLTSGAGRTAFMQNIGGAKGLMQAGAMAAAPMLMDTTTKQPEIKTDANMGQRYSYAPGAVGPTPSPDVPGYGNQGQNFGQEQTYFRPQYAQIDNEAARKLYGFAAGGPVEAMSNANAIGMNTGYPQANIRTGAYATPYQQPMAQNVVTGAQDAAVDPYTGQTQFAEGGEVGGYTYDPVTQMYVKKGGEGATMVSPTGGISGASAGAGGSPNQPLSQQTIDFLDKETPQERETRMQGISDLISMAVPGGMAARALSGALSSSTAGNIANFFSPPGSQPNYGVPVDSRGTYAGNPMGQTSYESGEGNPGESGGFTNDAGGSEVSGSLGFAQGGISHLGDYSDGGRLLRGPGDGISDSIPAMIGKKQPARLADGEFVVPARIVSELGNGSTEAGARKLYAMMDRVQKARKKTVGKGKVAANSRSAKYLPA